MVDCVLILESDQPVMLKVTVMLPDGRKGEIAVHPTATINEVRKVIVDGLKLGNSEDFLLAIVDKDQSSSVSNIELREGDLLILIAAEETKQVKVALNEDSFVK